MNDLFSSNGGWSEHFSLDLADADIVCFIYRPEYYDIETFRDGDPAEGKAELIIAKHRNGSLADVRLRFQGSMAKFSDV